MADEAGAIYVKIKADIDDLKKGLQTAVGNMSAFKSSTVAIGNVLSSVFTNLTGRVATFAKDCVKSYLAHEQAVVKLSAAVGKEATPRFVEFAEKMQDVSTYSAEAVMGLESQLSAFGILPGSIEPATKALINFAAKTGKDLPSAANMMAMAMNGQTRELSKYGLQLDPAATRTENLSKTITFLNKISGDAALTMRNTTGGALQVLVNNFDDLKRKLAEAVIPAVIYYTDTLNWAIGVVKNYSMVGKDQLSVDQLAIEQQKQIMRGILETAKARSKSLMSLISGTKNQITLTAEEQKNYILAGKLITATEKRIELDKKAGDASKKRGADAVGATGKELTELQKLLNAYALATAQHQMMQQNMTQINALETQKRLDASADSWEKNTSFSDQLKVKFTQDADSQTATWVGMANTMVDSFAQGTAKMIMEGGRMVDVLKNLWRAMAEAFIAEVIRMIVKMAILNAMTGVGGGAARYTIGSVFGARGGMVDEPSLLIGMKSKKTAVVGEAGPEAIVPSNKGGFSTRSAGTSSGGGGESSGNITIIIQGQFLEASPSKWSRFIKEQIIPEIRRSTMAIPSGPFNRVRGAI